MTDAKPNTTMKRFRAISEAQFVAAKRRSAAESAVADREGDDADSGVDTYWIGWTTCPGRTSLLSSMTSETRRSLIQSWHQPKTIDTLRGRPRFFPRTSAR